MKNAEAVSLSFEETARVLSAAPSWIIFSHQKLDGDAIGTASALFEAGVQQGKRVRWIGPDPIPPAYSFLAHSAEYVCSESFNFDSEADLYVFLDSANSDRGVKGLQYRAPNVTVLNIDHHEDNSCFGTLNCVDPTSSSAAELLWKIMNAGKWTINSTVAESLYVGIMADTGAFMYDNTTAATHQIVSTLLEKGVKPARIDGFIRQTRSLPSMHLWGIALGRISCWGEKSQFAITWLTRQDFTLVRAESGDTESLVNQMLLIKSVRFAVFLNEGIQEVKASFRSKEGILPAATVARIFGGGGHPRAAGAALELPIESAVQLVKEVVDRAYAEWLVAD